RYRTAYSVESSVDPSRFCARADRGHGTTLQQDRPAIDDGELDVDGMPQTRLEVLRDRGYGPYLIVIQAGALPEERRRLDLACAALLSDRHKVFVTDGSLQHAQALFVEDPPVGVDRSTYQAFTQPPTGADDDLVVVRGDRVHGERNARGIATDQPLD